MTPTPEHLAKARSAFPCEHRGLQPTCDEYMTRAMANPAYAGEGTFGVCGNCAAVPRVAALLTEAVVVRCCAEGELFFDKIVAERDTLKADAERLREELALLRDHPELDQCSQAVYVARMIAMGSSYDAQSGLWWGNSPESKPGIIQMLEAERDSLKAQLANCEAHSRHDVNLLIECAHDADATVEVLKAKLATLERDTLVKAAKAMCFMCDRDIPLNWQRDREAAYHDEPLRKTKCQALQIHKLLRALGQASGSEETR